MEEKESIIFGSKKEKCNGKKEECIRLVRKKYNRLARRNAVHQTEKIKWLNGGKRRNVSIWGKNYVTGGRRNPQDLKKIA
jgi:hypothetical protein